MAGSYSHTNRSAGTVVTSAIYNADHQNHIDNLNPDKIDDWSADDTQMGLATDPFPAQAATSRPSNLDGEVTRLRYMVKQVLDYLNGVNNSGSSASATTALGTAISKWYYGIKNPALRTVGCRLTNTTAFGYTTSGLKAITYDTESFDQDGGGVGFHSTVSNTSRITIPTGLGGKYLVTCSGQWAANSDTGIRVLALRVDGTTVVAAQGQSVSVNATYDVSVTSVLHLNAGQYIEAVCQAGANFDFRGPQATTSSIFSAVLIGS
jgi:hypothetical protein